MQFTPQTITILQPEYIPTEIEAMIGENSGLAYYKTTGGYIVTTTHSGYYVAWLKYGNELPEHSSPLNERIVQRFIEVIAPWLDWTQNKDDLEAQADSRYGTTAMQSRLWQAFCEVRAQIMTVDVSK